MTTPTIETTYKVINDVECKLEHYTYFYDSGSKKREEFYANGLKHNEPNLFSPKMTYPDLLHEDDGDIEDEEHKQILDEYYDVMNLNDNIAVIEYDLDGNVTNVENWLHGKQLPIYKVLKWAGRDNYSSAEYGTIMEEIYLLNGLEHNENDYSYSYTSDDCNCHITQWKQHGKFYNTNGPAYTKSDYTGNEEGILEHVKKVWYNDEGLIHRQSGYAVEVVHQDIDGEHIVDDLCEKWINGTKL